MVSCASGTGRRERILSSTDFVKGVSLVQPTRVVDGGWSLHWSRYLWLVLLSKWVWT